MQETELPVLEFKTQSSWRDWLEKNNTNSLGIWVRMFKKATGIASINHEQLLDEALCYGWIDGQAKPYDEKSWLQRFTPRRTKSMWSKRNIEHVTRLITLGKMKVAGLTEVEKAKADGRWDAAYDAPSQMTIPADFLKELEKDKKSYEFFSALNKTNKYAITWRLQTAKKAETPAKRINMILQMLSKGEKFH